MAFRYRHVGIHETAPEDGVVDFYIVCNGSECHITPAEGHERAAQLDAEWGGEQCEGCGADIVECGTVNILMTRVRCRECGAGYDVRHTGESETAWAMRRRRG